MLFQKSNILLQKLFPLWRKFQSFISQAQIFMSYTVYTILGLYIPFPSNYKIIHLSIFYNSSIFLYTINTVFSLFEPISQIHNLIYKDLWSHLQYVLRKYLPSLVWQNPTKKCTTQHRCLARSVDVRRVKENNADKSRPETD